LGNIHRRGGAVVAKRKTWILIGSVLALGIVLIVAGSVALFGNRMPAPASTPTSTLVVSTPSPAAWTLSVEPSSNLLVKCNAPAELRLADTYGKDIAQGECDPKKPKKFWDLRRGTYILHASNQDLGIDLQQQLTLLEAEQEVAALFPGLLEISPVPTDATVEVDGKAYHGLTRVTYPAEQCPISTTVWVKAAGYEPYGTILVMKAGQAYRQEVVLEVVPTANVPGATPRPTPPPVTATPTTPPWTVDERVALVRQKLYESANCTRAANGLSLLPYLSEWQTLADDFARGWRDYYLQNGPTGMDDSSWRQQFQAAGGDAVRETAGLVLYAPDYYIYLAPQGRWESFNMCEPGCPAYNFFEVRESDLLRASGVVIGLAPWWDGEVLNAAVVLGVKW
jgi:hypothetical protein